MTTILITTSRKALQYKNYNSNNENGKYKWMIAKSGDSFLQREIKHGFTVCKANKVLNIFLHSI